MAQLGIRKLVHFSTTVGQTNGALFLDTTAVVRIVKTEEDSHFNDKPGVVGGNPRIEEIIDSDGVKIICYLSKNTRFKSE